MTTYTTSPTLTHSLEHITREKQTLRQSRLRLYDDLEEREQNTFSYQEYVKFLTDPHYTFEKHQRVTQLEIVPPVKKLEEIYIHYKEGTKKLFQAYYPLTEEELVYEIEDYPVDYYDDQDTDLFEDEEWSEILDQEMEQVD